MISKTFIFLLIFLLNSCGSAPEEEEPVAEASKSLGQVVGEVSSVHSDQGFLLFRNHRGHDFSNAGSLSARSVDGRRIVPLSLNPESLGRYHAATYASEEAIPRVGDLVVLATLGGEEKVLPTPEIMTQKQIIN